MSESPERTAFFGFTRPAHSLRWQVAVLRNHELATESPAWPGWMSIPSLPGAERELTPSELALLVRIQQAVSNRRDRASLLAAVAGATRDALPAERITLIVSDPSHPDAVLSLAKGAPESESGPLAGADLESALVVPLLIEDRRLGALAFSAAGEQAWQHLAPGFFVELGKSVASALDNCLAYEQSRGYGDELQALLDVNVAIGRHLERDELFGALASCLRNLLPAERFGIELPIDGGRLQGHLLNLRSEGAERTQPTVLPAEGTACNWVLQNKMWTIVSARDELRETFPVTFEVMEKGGMESLVAMPLTYGARCPGVLFFMAARKGAYQGLRRGLIERVASAVAVALDDCLAHEEVRRLRDQLAAENVYLQEEIRQDHNFEEFVGQSPALRGVLRAVERVAPTESTVLILGETGTGKELIARAVHFNSPRKSRPLIKVNCAALPASLIESELFGHEKGSFTGATERRIGRFELADGGTIFLDEIGELSAEVQVKLLRVLQERELERVGGSKTIKVDVRVIAATNRDLASAAASGSFRQDLYYRLSVFPVLVPPLRERCEDISSLVQHFVARYAAKIGRKITRVPREAMDRLLAYSWPGNVRELENVLERAVILSVGRDLEIPPELLPRTISTASRATVSSADVSISTNVEEHVQEPPSDALEDVERSYIREVLEKTSWRIEGPSGAASILELNPSTLRSRIRKLGIQRIRRNG